MSIQFEDYSIEVKAKLRQNAVAFLYAAAELVKSAAIRLTPSGYTRELRDSYENNVDENSLVATVGNTAKHSIYVEMGTGEYALEGNGRKTPWRYQDVKGNWHTTSGQKPRRMLYHAFRDNLDAVKQLANEYIGEGFD